MLTAHVATLNRSPRNPILNKENSRGTICDISIGDIQLRHYAAETEVKAMGHTKCRVVIGYKAAHLLQSDWMSPPFLVSLDTGVGDVSCVMISPISH